jgi:hypothetical protein
MRLSDAAARVLPGLWCEADDNGVFRWEPDTLRARILPLGSHDMDAILVELEAADWIRRFEGQDGGEFGACRNFKVYQKTKHASHRYSEVLPPELLGYIKGESQPSPKSGEPSPKSGEPSPYKGSKGEDGKGAGSVEPPPATPGGIDWVLFTATADNPETGKILYGPAREWLAVESSLIAKWVKQMGGDTAAVLAFAQDAFKRGIGDPKPYIAKAVNNALARSGKTPNGQLVAGWL